ncbi:2-hydroxychromene-2-carboxylate isomerase [wastewater metagenome]|uniref:2-hydroxychromene-2-carboxylate isomerase n=2 Tax=unclassified sequences TaxID=12908 RepID=A0A5B8RB97_9ZZZZ|nr:2-hydroxychromene-2-carboxylate isomerase [Arhodomonas sp. KWT]QEA05901.1 2-hydroxychromene-2-carboxylate isomerase [uncultured organism]
MDTALDWYFDVVSPFSWFALQRLDALPSEPALHPVVLGAVLSHWGQKGPAEIPGKRLWTYRVCVRYAQTHGIPLRFPAAHPFNPVPYLRLAVAAGCGRRVVHHVFEYLWTTGVDPRTEAAVAGAAERLGVSVDAAGEASVRARLRSETAAAIERGVFGVPTLAVGDELFWGNDGMDFALAYLAEPAVLDTAEMRRVAALPDGLADRG